MRAKELWEALERARRGDHTRLAVALMKLRLGASFRIVSDGAGLRLKLKGENAKAYVHFDGLSAKIRFYGNRDLLEWFYYFTDGDIRGNTGRAIIYNPAALKRVLKLLRPGAHLSIKLSQDAPLPFKKEHLIKFGLFPRDVEQWLEAGEHKVSIVAQLVPEGYTTVIETLDALSEPWRLETAIDVPAPERYGKTSEIWNTGTGCFVITVRDKLKDAAREHVKLIRKLVKNYGKRVEI